MGGVCIASPGYRTCFCAGRVSARTLQLASCVLTALVQLIIIWMEVASQVEVRATWVNSTARVKRSLCGYALVALLPHTINVWFLVHLWEPYSPSNGLRDIHDDCFAPADILRTLLPLVPTVALGNEVRRTFSFRPDSLICTIPNADGVPVLCGLTVVSVGAGAIFNLVHAGVTPGCALNRIVEASLLALTGLAAGLAGLARPAGHDGRPMTQEAHDDATYDTGSTGSTWATYDTGSVCLTSLE